MTTPLPSRIFWQACATLRTLTTLRAASATTASLACEASGGSTVTIGARLDGCVTSVICESDSTTLPQPVATPIDRAMAAISEAVDRIRLIEETIEPSFVALSVGQAQRRCGALRYCLLHSNAVGFRSLVVVDQHDAVVLHREHILGNRLADAVSCALVEVDFNAHDAS